MTDLELCYTPAADLARMIRDREVSSVEVTRAVLDRIGACESTLNAMMAVCDERALVEAAAADEAVAAGGDVGPLHGVPFTVKDLVATEGVTTTFGSHVFADNVPAADAWCVKGLRDAGALLVGKTTTPEFGHKPFTEGPLFGRTLNPWDTTRTSGGSSGGAGAAAAAGYGPLHVGTDGGGSTRIPAACCGVVGLKQTLGRVVQDMTPDSFNLLSYIGPITRTVTDAALMMDAMGGEHLADVHSRGRPVPDFAAAVAGATDLKGKRIGWRLTLGNDVVDTETAKLFEDARDAFAEAGAELVLHDDTFNPTMSIWGPMTFSMWAARFGKYRDQWGNKMTSTLLKWMADGDNYSAIDLQRALEERTRLYRQVEGWFQDIDLLLTPTLARTALPADHDPFQPVEIEGTPVGEIRSTWYPYTHPFNLSGNPAITLPAGWHSDGLPVAIQIVGPWLADADVLAAARVYERLRPWSERRPEL